MGEQDLSQLTSDKNEYFLPEGVHRQRDGQPVLDQRDAMPEKLWRWVEELPTGCAAELWDAFEAFKATGAVTSTDTFRDFLVAQEMTIDYVFHVRASAHLSVGYAKEVNEAFSKFMQHSFGKRLMMAPMKRIDRILAKTREDIPELKDEKAASQQGELRCGYMQLSDVVRCTLEADGSQDTIAVVNQLRQLNSMGELGKFEVWRIKNTHHQKVQDQELVGGYRDVKVLGRFSAKDLSSTGLPLCMLVEVQVVDTVFLKVKGYMHLPYAILRGDFTTRALNDITAPISAQSQMGLP